MERAQSGDSVSVHYTGKLEDGTIFDSSIGKPPLNFTLGQNQVISGFEQAIEGMAPGENKTAVIPSNQAYGSYREDLIVTVDRAQVPPALNPEVGQQLELQQENGEPIPVVVTEVSEDSLTLDANHPLAGLDLTFEIELVEIH